MTKGKTFFFIFCMIFLVSFVSAFDFDNVKSYDEETETITIKNSILGIPFLDLDTIAKVRLTENTRECKESCFAEGEIILFEERKLMDSLRFEKLINGTWEDSVIFDSKIFINKSESVIVVPDYVYNCEFEYTLLDDCTKNQVGSHNEVVINWTEYTGEILKSGNYKWRIEGTKRRMEMVDWLATFFSLEINSWAIWGGDTNMSFRFEDNLIDSEGNYHINNASAVDGFQAGRVGQALIVDTDDLVFINNTLPLSYNRPEWSYTFWFEPYETWDSSAGVTYPLKELGGAGSYAAILGYDWQTDGALQFTRQNGPTITSAARDFTGGVEYFIAMIFNGTDNLLYINRTLVGTSTDTTMTSVDATTKLKDSGKNYTIDELKFFTWGLTESEVFDIYDTELSENEAPTVTLNSPANNTGFTTNNITFNITATDDSMIQNLSLYINGILNFTVTDGVDNNTELNITLNFTDGNYNWTGIAYDNSSEQAVTETRLFTVDSNLPEVNVTAPSGFISFHILGNNLTINWTATDTNLDSCWFNYDGINTTVICGDNNYSFVTTTQTNLTFYVNDTVGNLGSNFTSWSYNVIENSQTYNTSSYETATETFILNISGNNASTITAELIYNSTNQGNGTRTISGGDSVTFTKTLDVSTLAGAAEDKPFYWKLLNGGAFINSTNTTQRVSQANFNLCSATLTSAYVNYTFADEGNLSILSAKIPSSAWVYWLGSGVVNKSLTFINNSANLNYAFCFTPQNRTMNIDYNLQYEASGYPQRIFSELTTFLNITTNKTLYLLSTADGIYVTFQVLSQAEQTISGVAVNVTRSILSATTLVGIGNTDPAGLITFWLNPDFSHAFSFFKTGYDLYTASFFPTQSEYTIILNNGTTTPADYTQGISRIVSPSQDFLDQDNLYNFSLNLTSSFWTLDYFNFTIFYANNTTIGSNSSTVGTGGFINFINVNVSNQSSVYMNYYYSVNSTVISYSRTWIIQLTEGRDYSIFNFVTNLSSQLSLGLLGFDNFGKSLISFIIIVLMVGGITRRYGLVSEPAAMGVLFGIVFFLDVGIGFIPPIQVGNIRAIDNFVTFITFLILVGIVIREERR